MAPETERIPDDVVEEILVRLPVKPLTRFSRKKHRRNNHSLRDFRICLWNPSIRKFKIIEPEDKGFDDVAYGFAFHSQNNDFKFLRFGRSIMDGEPSSKGLLVHVYTLSIDSWSYLELQDITLVETPHYLFFNGALYHMAYSQNSKLILCFDVHDHNFWEIMLPQDYSNGLDLEFERLAVFKGSLALIAFGHQVCCIWEYGPVGSWTRTDIVLPPHVENFFGCTGSGQLVITNFSNQLFLFDPDSHNEINLGLEDLAPDEDLVPLVYTPNLIESLVLLNE
ncbi:putative F-box protein At1g47730 [Castanea sativa]|uniref:putative F-box protein At1g47730 n=1 Tax=Castanea sativa TaxID=21020 RepID=UPI003F64B8FD